MMGAVKVLPSVGPRVLVCTKVFGLRVMFLFCFFLFCQGVGHTRFVLACVCVRVCFDVITVRGAVCTFGGRGMSFLSFVFCLLPFFFFFQPTK